MVSSSARVVRVIRQTQFAVMAGDARRIKMAVPAQEMPIFDGPFALIAGDAGDAFCTNQSQRMRV